MPICPLCWNMRFDNFTDFYFHNVAEHPHHAQMLRIKRDAIRETKNTSGRTLKEIVRDAEDTWLAPYII